jgi:sec-independent protein translocase protein TatC
MAEKEMTFLEHLEELRQRIIISLVAVGLFFVISYIFSEHILRFILLPYIKNVSKNPLVFITPVEAFLTYLKVAFFSGIFFASPVILYEFWAFVSPALYPHEKKVALPTLLLSVIFFVGGCAFCYFIVLPIGIRYLIVGFSSDMLSPMISVGKYLSFSLIFILAFGLIFETPLVLFFMNRLGLIQLETLTKNRRVVIVIIFIIAAILTPPDVVSQILLAVPLLILFELTILAIKIFGRKK